MYPLLQIQWADACLLVYSVTDRSSFEYATEVLSALRRTPSNGSPAHGQAAQAPMPLALLANKTDLDHLRQVGEDTNNFFRHTQLSIVFRNKVCIRCLQVNMKYQATSRLELNTLNTRQ